MIDFPDFNFGTATASHQIEGNNKYNDWWAAEQKSKNLDYKSGKACDHWNRYEQDIELMDELNYDSYRFSLEWSRIFPEEGEVNEEPLKRYQTIIDLLNERDITPMVTLHHFTLPKWFLNKGG
ncbi:MAG: family 1 glycosylhydrolase, partial [Candidatus Saliniplasma sp.]